MQCIHVIILMVLVVLHSFILDFLCGPRFNELVLSLIELDVHSLPLLLCSCSGAEGGTVVDKVSAVACA